MTEAAELIAEPAPAGEDGHRHALRSLLKRRIITLYCIGFFSLEQTQTLIDHFRLWEA